MNSRPHLTCAQSAMLTGRRTRGRRIAAGLACGVSVALVAALSSVWSSGAATFAAGDANAAADKRRDVSICMLSGALEYDSKTSLAILKKRLEQHAGVHCTLLHADDGSTDIPGLEALDKADLMIVFCRRLKLGDKPLSRVQAYCRSGRPIVGIRTASHAFQTWLAFDHEVLGGDYSNHYGAGPRVQVSVNPKHKDHPILAGVGKLTSVGSLYKNPKLAADATLLLTGTSGEHSEPVAWTRLNHGGRVFYTSIGHQDDFKNEQYLRLLENAVWWTLKRMASKD